MVTSSTTYFKLNSIEKGWDIFNNLNVHLEMFNLFYNSTLYILVN